MDYFLSRLLNHWWLHNGRRGSYKEMILNFTNFSTV